MSGGTSTVIVSGGTSTVIVQHQFLRRSVRLMQKLRGSASFEDDLISGVPVGATSHIFVYKYDHKCRVKIQPCFTGSCVIFYGNKPVGNVWVDFDKPIYMPLSQYMPLSLIHI